jgi:hypothetical protein
MIITILLLPLGHISFSMPRRASVPSPVGDLTIMKQFSYPFLFICFSFLCAVLVVRSLENPGELVALVGGLPALQSSWRGRRW